MSWLTVFLAPLRAGAPGDRAERARHGASKRRSGGRPRTQRPVVETLEDRLCPSVYDLASDWSDTSNPNGVWQYRHGTTVITNHEASWDPSDFVSPQPAWADAPSGFGFIPPWFQSVSSFIGDATYDVPIGRVATHTTDPTNGDDSAWSNVRWISPEAGVATISGDTWDARKSLDRSNAWALFHNDVILTGGILTPSDPFNSSNPFLFQNGSGGQDVLTFPVAVGDTIMFEAVRAFSIPGNFVGVDLTITVTEGAANPSGPANVFRPDGNLLMSAPTHSIKGYDSTTANYLGNFMPPNSGALYRSISPVSDAVLVSPSAPQGGGNPSGGGTDASRPSAPQPVTWVTPAPTAWGSAAGSVAPAMPQAPISPTLERPAKDSLFGAWATESSALEPLVWFADAKGDLTDGKR